MVKRKRSGGRRQTAAVKKQQSKMKAAARKWKTYKKSHPGASYQSFMKKELKK